MPARVIKFVPLFRGTVDGASVYPREVVKAALRRNAAAVIGLDHLVVTNDTIVSFADRGLL